MATAPHQPDQPQPPAAHQPTIEEKEKERAAEARKIFDGYDKEDLPVTTQTDQLRRAADMERVGPAAYMAEQERRIRERQGDPPLEPRQVHGVAPAKKP